MIRNVLRSHVYRRFTSFLDYSDYSKFTNRNNLIMRVCEIDPGFLVWSIQRFLIFTDFTTKKQMIIKYNTSICTTILKHIMITLNYSMKKSNYNNSLHVSAANSNDFYLGMSLIREFMIHRNIFLFFSFRKHFCIL